MNSANGVSEQFDMNLLLDTCAFLWLVADPDRLGQMAAAAIQNPDTQLFLSDTSVWELSLKWQARKISLPSPPRRWVEEQTQVWKVRPLAIHRGHLYRVTELPEHHRDPFDRLLVAQAIEEGLSIATPDPYIQRYPVAVVW